MRISKNRCLVILVLIFFLGLVFSGCATTGQAEAPKASRQGIDNTDNAISGSQKAVTDLESLASEFVDMLVKEDFSSAVKGFDATMSKAMPADKLQQTWTSLTGQIGKFKKQIKTRKEKIQQYNAVFVTCEFEKINFDIRVVFDSKSKIAGLFFSPSN